MSTGEPAEDTLPAEHFRSLARLEDRYWWHQTRYRAALAALTRAGATAGWSIGDVGCGTGGFLRFLRALSPFLLFACGDFVSALGEID